MALYQVISQFIIPLMGRFICRFSVAQSPEASIDLHSIACGPSHFQLTLRDTAVAAGEVQGSGAPGLEHLGTLWSLFGSGICSHFGHHLELLTMRGWCVRYKKNTAQRRFHVDASCIKIDHWIRKSGYSIGFRNQIQSNNICHDIRIHHNCCIIKYQKTSWQRCDTC